MLLLLSPPGPMADIGNGSQITALGIAPVQGCRQPVPLLLAQNGPRCHPFAGLNLTGSPRLYHKPAGSEAGSAQPTVPSSFAQETNGMSTCTLDALAHVRGPSPTSL